MATEAVLAVMDRAPSFTFNMSAKSYNTQVWHTIHFLEHLSKSSKEYVVFFQMNPLTHSSHEKVYYMSLASS